MAATSRRELTTEAARSDALWHGSWLAERGGDPCSEHDLLREGLQAQMACGVHIGVDPASRLAIVGP